MKNLLSLFILFFFAFEDTGISRFMLMRFAPTRRIEAALCWLLVCFYGLSIFQFSSLSHPIVIAGLPSVHQYNFDKLFHFTEYMIFAMVVGRALAVTFRFVNYAHFARAVFLSTFFYACTDEFHQIFVPHRDPSYFDLMADGTGILVGILFWLSKASRRQLIQPDPAVELTSYNRAA